MTTPNKPIPVILPDDTPACTVPVPAPIVATPNDPPPTVITPAADDDIVTFVTDDRPPELADLVNHLADTAPEPTGDEAAALATLSAQFDAEMSETSLPDLEEAFEGLAQSGISNATVLTTASACCATFDDALVWFSRKVAAAEKAGHVAFRGDFSVVVRRTGLFGQGETDIHFDVNFTDSDADVTGHTHEGPRAS